MQSSIGPRVFTVSNTCHSKPWGYVSDAFLKITKQEYNLPCVCFCLSIRNFSTKILAVVQQSFLKTACPLALMPSASAQTAVLWSKIIPNKLAITDPTVMPRELLMSPLSPDLWTAVIKPTDSCLGKCRCKEEEFYCNMFSHTSSPLSSCGALRLRSALQCNGCNVVQGSS